MKRAIVRINSDVLADLLQLPPGAYIDNVRDDPVYPGVLELRVVNAG